MTSQQFPWTSALSEEQIYKKKYFSLFEEWWKDPGQFSNIQELIASRLNPLKNRYDLLAALSPQEKLTEFFAIKEQVNNATDLLHIFFEVGKDSPYREESAIQQLFEQCLHTIKTYHTTIDQEIPFLKTQRILSLSQEEIGAFCEELRLKVLTFRSAIVPLADSAFEELLTQSYHNLYTSLCYILQHYSSLLQLLFTLGKSVMYFPSASCPYPFVLTPQGDCYLILFDAINQIGKGSVKGIFRALHLNKKRWIAAVKSRSFYPGEEGVAQEKSGTITFLRLFFEANVIKMLQLCEGIMPLYDIFPFQTGAFPELFLFEELFEFQDLNICLKSAIHHREKACFLSPQQQEKIAHLLLKILMGIHHAGIIHRSIKPANFLLKKNWDPEQIILVVIDFEDSCFINDSERRKSIRALPAIDPPEYAQMKLKKSISPQEIIRCNDTPYDVWGMGLILYQLFLLKPLPWKEIPKLEQTPLIARLSPDWARAALGEHPIAPLLLSMLEIDPSQRISAEKALHTFETLISSPAWKRFIDGLSIE